MANTVTFPNGNSYNDGDSGTGHMGNGGHRSNFLPLIGDTIDLADTYMGYVDDAAAAKTAAETAKTGAETAKTGAESARDAAAASADAAARI